MYKNYEEKIFQGVYEANEKYGIGGLTTKIISMTCDVSEGSFYRHFESKEDLLLQAYINIDKEIASLFGAIDFPKPKSTLFIPKKSILKVIRTKMWEPYLQYLLDNPKKALFYIQYVELYGDNQDQFVANEEKGLKEYYYDFMSSINSNELLTSALKKVDSQIAWTAMIDTTLTFAKKIIQGKIKDTPENRTAMFNIIYSGVISFF